jgi:hypothetical protein
MGQIGVTTDLDRYLGSASEEKPRTIWKLPSRCSSPLGGYEKGPSPQTAKCLDRNLHRRSCLRRGRGFYHPGEAGVHLKTSQQGPKQTMGIWRAHLGPPTPSGRLKPWFSCGLDTVSAKTLGFHRVFEAVPYGFHQLQCYPGPHQDWCRWVLGRVRAEDPGAAGLAATSSKSSKEAPCGMGRAQHCRLVGYTERGMHTVTGDMLD